MSLKAFHILFVTAAILLAIGFGGWAVREYWRVGGAVNLVMALGSFTCGVLLLVYGRWFWQNLNGLML